MRGGGPDPLIRLAPALLAVGINENQANRVRFATIRSFKGLEADIVFLSGLKKGSPVCTETDIYVGGSRARFLLYVFHERSLQFTN